MRILVTGWTGFLGGAVVGELLRVRGAHVLGAARAVVGGDASAGFEQHAVDVAEPGAATRVLDATRPDAVVHLAALANIASCRADPALAARLNADAPGEIAAWCAAHDVRFVHVSTDQVFDGSRGGWLETDEPRPLHLYGVTKLAGERAVLAACPGAAVVRPALITGLPPGGGVSSSSALRTALTVGDTVRLFTDEIRTPVAVLDVARALADLVERREASGLFHCGGPEAISRHELGLREADAAELDATTIEASTREAAGLAAERPADLSLDSTRLTTLLGWTPRLLA